jgi:hypothetical protein
MCSTRDERQDYEGYSYDLYCDLVFTGMITSDQKNNVLKVLSSAPKDSVFPEKGLFLEYNYDCRSRNFASSDLLDWARGEVEKHLQALESAGIVKEKDLNRKIDFPQWKDPYFVDIEISMQY